MTRADILQAYLGVLCISGAIGWYSLPGAVAFVGIFLLLDALNWLRRGR